MNEYVVERIVGVRRNKRRRTQYLVKWEGWDSPTWEPAANMTHCREKIDEFHAQAQADDEADVDGEIDVNEAQVDGEAGTCEIGKSDVDNDDEIDVNAVDQTQADGEAGICEFDEGDGGNGAEPAAHRVEEQSQRRQSVCRARAVQNEGFLDSDVSGDESGDDTADEDDSVIVLQESGGADDDDDDDAEEQRNRVLAGPHEDLNSGFLRKLAESGFLPTYYGEDVSKAAEAYKPFSSDPTVSDEAIAVAKTMEPIDLLFFFMPKTLWCDIAKETNRYERQTREERIRLARVKLRQKYSRQVAAEKFAEAQIKIGEFREIDPHEIVVLLGLLVARSLCPMRSGLEHHWTSTQNGAVPAGTWSRFMTRQRYREISRFLHFSDNKNPMAKKDRAWKIRPVVDTLQRTFKAGLHLGKWIAFDEMVIPSRSSRNSIRVYLKNKPHKYGTKLFAVCCGETSYCARMEVYCGARQDREVVDTFSGAAAVIRNLKALYPKTDKSQMRIVVTDREYTCVTLSVRLFAMGFCSIGTVTPSRLGFPTELKYKFKTVPKRLTSQRGLCKLLRCTEFPSLYACSWLDNKPVYFLAHGVSTLKTEITRKEKNGSSVQVGCPAFVESYNRYMNGVDGHDQLRLQRYSVQRSLCVKKYYKTLFFGLFDMALVNAYIVHCQYCKSIKQKALSHARFRTVLHEQMINVTLADFDGQTSPPTPNIGRSPRQARTTVTSHRLELSDDKQMSGKMRYRVCKVCSILQSERGQPIGKSRAFCVECSTEKCRVYLCDRIRGSDDGNHMTCFQIWHQLWQNGTARDGNKQIRMRAAASTASGASTESLVSPQSFVSLHISDVDSALTASSYDFAS